uniref:Uncharacterized protein n=1 Tax=Arundo donax TaxID=35708 RepID=A0A0A9BG08_ARUDO
MPPASCLAPLNFDKSCTRCLWYAPGCLPLVCCIVSIGLWGLFYIRMNGLGFGI